MSLDTLPPLAGMSPGDLADLVLGLPDHVVPSALASLAKASTLVTQYPTPGALARALDPTVNQTPALDLIDAELVRLVSEPGGRLIVSMPPQQGKSSRVSQVFPVWALMRDPNLPIIVASYGEQLAERNGETIRNLIRWNAPKLGIDVESGSSSKKRWRLANSRGGVLSAGIGSGMTGWASGLTIIDDPIKDRLEADSEVYRERVWSWWRDVAQTRLAPGAPVVVVLTRWHTDDLAGRLLSAPDGARWRVVNIPAQADHDPARGESDALGRAPGEYILSARRERDPRNPLGPGRPMAASDWEKIKVGVGSRTWAALYQGRPAPAEGGLFQRAWWREYTQPLWIDAPDGARRTTNPGDQVIISADFAFKDTADSDYVAIGVWLKRGPNAYLLDQIHDRLDFIGSMQALRQLAARWPQAALKLVEDKANGTAIINALSRDMPGIVPEVPRGGKTERANAIVPFVEAGNVWLPSPEIAPWIGDYLEEMAYFPGKHDDQVDQTTQALNRLLLSPILDGAGDYVPDEFADLDMDGFVYSLY